MEKFSTKTQTTKTDPRRNTNLNTHITSKEIELLRLQTLPKSRKKGNTSQLIL